MEQMFQEIGEMCIDKGIKIADIPEFVYDLSKNSIPFSAKSKYNNKDIKAVVQFGKDFNYEKELQYSKLTIDTLPDRVKESLYEF